MIQSQQDSRRPLGSNSQSSVIADYIFSVDAHTDRKQKGADL